MCRRSARKILLGVSLALGFTAPLAQAHLVTTGLGPVYDGLGHFFLSPDDTLAALALAIFAGLRGPATGRRAMAVLPLAWIAGGAAALTISLPALDGRVPSALSLVLLGILVASDATLPARAVLILALVVGGAHGFYNGLAMREVGPAPAMLQLIGIGVALFVLVTLLAAMVVALRLPTARIVIRVAGSWTAAIGLLLLGWAFRLRR